MRLKHFIFMALFTFLSPQLGLGAEVDNFYHRYTPLKDEKIAINLNANQVFRQALEAANKSTKKCDEKELFQNLRKFFKNHYTDHFTKSLYLAKELDHRKIPFSQSIYKNLNAADSIVIGFMGKIYNSASPIINFNGHQIGTDKFEHFFGRGLAYYKLLHKKNKSIEDVLNFGLNSEKKILGLQTTGVMSYGDMAANFRGLFFWNHLLMKYPDPINLPAPTAPYVRCDGSKWVQNFDIDLSLYVDDAWDEAINCSKFRNDKIAEKINLVQKEYELEDPSHFYTCPVDSLINDALNLKYQPYSKWFINNGQNLLI